jgi:hypothetical protein
MLSSLRQSRPRRGLVAATACVILLGASASGAQSAPSDPAFCLPTFTAQTLQDALVRYAGFITDQEIRSGFAEHDVNGNGIVCGRPYARDRFFPLQTILDDRTTQGPR